MRTGRGLHDSNQRDGRGPDAGSGLSLRLRPLHRGRIRHVANIPCPYCQLIIRKGAQYMVTTAARSELDPFKNDPQERTEERGPSEQGAFLLVRQGGAAPACAGCRSAPPSAQRCARACSVNKLQYRQIGKRGHLLESSLLNKLLSSQY
eukprot:gene7718-biopygen10593